MKDLDVLLQFSLRINSIQALEAASEILVRVPVAALLLAFCGALSSALITGRSRTVAVAAAWFTPLVLIAGATALWYADQLERAARPPFVIAGVLSAGIALCCAHPIWSSLSRRHREPPPAT